MTDDATTTPLLRQLAAYRQTAAHEAQRAARYGGERAAPPEIAANLADARASIARLKAALRDLGVEVDDLPGDEPPPGAAPVPAPAAVVQQIIGGGSGNIQANNSTVTVTHYAGDNIAGDKVMGDKVAGDKHEHHHHYPPAPPGPVPLTLADMPLGDDSPIPEPAPLPPGSRMPLSRNPLFVGRAGDLRRLAGALASGVTTTTAAVTGLGGVGKTQLASEFAHRYGQFFEGGVLWLSFADPNAVAAEVVACGGISGMNLSGFDTLPFDQQVARVKAAWLEPTPRLLVFDNCEDEHLFDEWRPTSGGCRVLITSRASHWDSWRISEEVQLGVLPRLDSIALLRRFRPDLSDNDLDLAQIAAELGDLPLALHIAGSFLKRYARAVTPTAYLARLRAPERQWALLTIDDRSPTGREQDVARTFLLSYQRLQPTQPADALAIALLARAAYLAPGEPIPRELLAATVKLEGDDAALRYEDALARLGELGLLGEEADGALRMHRLISAFARATVRDEEAQESVEKALIGIGNRASTLHAEYLALAPLQSHLRLVVSLCGERTDRRAAQLHHLLAGYLRWSYDMPRALDTYAVALKLYKAVGDHLGEANVLQTVGDVHQFQTEMGAALESYAASLTLYRSVGERLGEANVQKAIGDVHQFRKEMDAALESYAAALALYRSVGERLGEANVQMAIGDVQQFRKEMDAALESYAAALKLYQTLGAKLGEADVMRVIGNVHQFRKEMDAALESYAAALTLYRSVGERVGEANVQKAIGDVQQFRKEMGAALELYAASLKHYRSVGDRIGEADVLLAMGDVQQFRKGMDAALDFYQAALTLYCSVGERVGEANVHKAIGDVQQYQKHLAAALQSYEVALKLYRVVGERLGEAHVLAAQGQIELVEGNQVTAEMLFDQAVAIYEEIGVRYHIASQTENYGWALRRTGRKAEAAPYLQRAAEVFAAIGMEDFGEECRQAAADSE